MKTNYQLIKIQDKFILVSDEDLQVNDYFLVGNVIEQCLSSSELDDLSIGKQYPKIIAGIPELPKTDFSLLKEADCKTIGFVDVEKLACNIYDLSFDQYKYIREHLSQTRELITEHYSDFGRSEIAEKYFDVISFIDGSNYKKTAQSLNDKMLENEIFGTQIQVVGDNKTQSIREFIQTLQQTSWDVEINELNQIIKIT